MRFLPTTKKEKEKYADAAVHLAQEFIGVREIGGNNQGQIVKLFQSKIGRAEGEPWCLSFLQWVIGVSARVRNFKNELYPTEHCVTLWQKTKMAHRVDIPMRGAIMVLQRRGTTYGHVALIERVVEFSHNRVHLQTIEGNTAVRLVEGGEQVRRDGDGVARTYRVLTRGEGGKFKIGNFVLLGYLYPYGKSSGKSKDKI